MLGFEKKEEGRRKLREAAKRTSTVIVGGKMTRDGRRTEKDW